MLGYAASSGRAGRPRISRIDRMWLDGTTVIAAGPLDLPTRGELVAALLAVAQNGPAARAGLGFDRSPYRWSFDPAQLALHCDGAVTELPDVPDGDLDAVLAELGRSGTVDRPLRLVLAGSYLFLAIRHALGDARFVLGLPEALLGYCHGDGLPDWVGEPVDAHPLRSALVATFGRDRSRVRELIAHARTPAPPRHDDAERESVALQPDPTVVSEAGTGARKAMTAWGKANAPGAALAALVVSAVHQALSEAGVATAPGLHMVYDARRFLPDGHVTHGNFVIGLDLSADLTDPLALSRAAAAAQDCGRPVAAMAASVTKSWVPRRPPDQPSASTPPRAHLACSFLGKQRSIERLPWTGAPDQRRYFCRVDPSGPESITLLPILVGDALQLSASFHASVFDSDTIRSAMRAVVDDPAGLLDRLRST